MNKLLALCLALSGSTLACSEREGTVGANQFERGFALEGTAQQVYDAIGPSSNVATERWVLG